MEQILGCSFQWNEGRGQAKSLEDQFQSTIVVRGQD